MTAFVVQSYNDYQNHEIARIVEAMNRYIVLELVGQMAEQAVQAVQTHNHNNPTDNINEIHENGENDENDEKFMNTIAISAKYMYLNDQLLKNTKELQQITTFNRIASVRDPKKTLRKMLVSGDNHAYTLFVRRYVLETAINKLRVSRSSYINYDDIPML